MELTGVVGLAGLIAVVVGVSILSIASMTLASGIAATANMTTTRKVKIGSDPDGKEHFREIKWFTTDAASGHWLRKRLARYPLYVMIFYATIAVPVVGIFAALAFGYMVILNTGGSDFQLQLSESAPYWVTSLYQANIFEFVLAMTTAYCLFVVLCQAVFKFHLYRLYNSLEVVMVEDKLRELGLVPPN